MAPAKPGTEEHCVALVGVGVDATVVAVGELCGVTIFAVIELLLQAVNNVKMMASALIRVARDNVE